MRSRYIVTAGAQACMMVNTDNPRVLMESAEWVLAGLTAAKQAVFFEPAPEGDICTCLHHQYYHNDDSGACMECPDCDAFLLLTFCRCGHTDSMHLSEGGKCSCCSCPDYREQL